MFKELQDIQEHQREGCVPMPPAVIGQPTPSGQTVLDKLAASLQQGDVALVLTRPDLAPLERELAEKDAKIAEQAAQIVALRIALENLNQAITVQRHRAERPLAITHITKKDLRFILFDICAELSGHQIDADNALSTPPPPVVPLEDVRPLVEAMDRIHHWHDCDLNEETGKTEGMVVSAEAVHALWKTRAEWHQKYPINTTKHPL